MLKFKIKEILLKSGIKHPLNWLMKECGFGYGKAHNLINSKQKSINLEDLTKLCFRLNCTPDGLFYWEETSKYPLGDDHPCRTQLKMPDKTGGWFKLFEKKTPEEIQKLYDKVIALENEGESDASGK